MDDETIAILTLPHNNQLSLIYNETNNLITLSVICFQLISLIALLITTLLIPRFYDNLPVSIKTSNLDASSLIVCSHIIVWTILLSAKIYLKKYHYRRLQKIGYHTHFRKVYWLSNVPHSIFNFCTICLLCVLIFFKSKPVDSSHLKNSSFDLVNYIQVIIILFVAMCCPSFIAQLYFELVFRKDKKPPDVFYLDDPQHLPQEGLGNIGLRSSTCLQELFEKQADLINNLKIHNVYLRQTLYRLSERQSLHNINE